MLGGLSRSDWNRETVCDGWSVKDIVAHILGDDSAALSAGRDGERGGWLAGSFAEVVAQLNQRNEAWVDAWRHASPAVLLELLERTGPSMASYYASLDPWAPGPAVDWAGQGPHQMWLHVARDLTERWLHQAQIRDAAEQAPFDDPPMMGAVLRTFARALPVAYQDLEAPDGASITIAIVGPAGSDWTVRRKNGEWTLLAGADDRALAHVAIDQDAAWRLWTKGQTPASVGTRASIEDQRALGEHALDAVAILA